MKRLIALAGMLFFLNGCAVHEVYTLKVNYDLSVESMMARGKNHCMSGGGIKDEHFPTIRKGEATVKMEFVYVPFYGSYRTAEEVIVEFKKRGLHLAKLNELLNKLLNKELTGEEVIAELEKLKPPYDTDYPSIFRREFTVEELIVYLKKRGLRLAQLHELLTYVAVYYNVYRRRYPIVTLGSFRQLYFIDQFVACYNDYGGQPNLSWAHCTVPGSGCAFLA